jgi:hypothetical protein
MRRAGALSVCLAVGIAICVAAAPSAFATLPEHPEYAKCVKQVGGSYDKGCGTLGGGGTGEGGWVLASAVGVKLTGKSETWITRLNGIGYQNVGCGITKLSGEITGASSLTETLTGNCGCTSTDPEGALNHMVSHEIDGRLVATEEAASGVGFEIKGAGAEDAIFDYECGAGEEDPLRISGAITGEQTENVGLASKRFGEVFTPVGFPATEPAIRTEGSNNTFFFEYVESEILQPSSLEADTAVKANAEVIVR